MTSAPIPVAAGRVVLVDHPLVQHKLGLMRRKDLSTASFRRLAREIATLLAYELTRDLPLSVETVETPLARMEAPVLAGKKLCLVPVLRAGLGLLDGMLDLVPSARVGHVGLFRDPASLAAAVTRVKEAGATSIRAACLLAAPEGLERFRAEHPDVDVFVAAIDSHLDAHGYIVPGLGDAGDRLFGTR
jgi:uracil phosphoribosyltransferase